MSNLTASLGFVFSQEDVIQRVVEVIKNLGVSSAMDLKYVEVDDLAGVLKPIQARKVVAHFKCKLSNSHKQLIRNQFHMLYKVLNTMHD